MQPGDLSRIRFSGEKALLDDLLKMPEVQRGNATAEALRVRATNRTELLASAVRMSTRMLPRLHESLDRVARLFGQSVALEAYVYPAPVINAFVSRQGSRTIVVGRAAARGRQLRRPHALGTEPPVPAPAHCTCPAPALPG